MKRSLIGFTLVGASLAVAGFTNGDRHRLHSFSLAPGRASFGYSWKAGDYSSGQRLEVFYTPSLSQRWKLLHTETVSEGMTNRQYAYEYPNTNAASGFFTVRAWEDSDGDGISDAREVLEFGSNPNSLDSDQDTIPDEIEVARGMDPDNPDSDDDGVTDEFEMLYGTDPLNPDSDYDGLTDAEEKYEYFSDPLCKDTDHDGIEDLKEVLLGYDPSSCYSKSSRFPDNIVILMGGREPDKVMNDSGEQLWEFVFNGCSLGEPLKPTARQADSALLTMKVKGSGWGVISIGGEEKFFMGPGEDAPARELQINIERGYTLNLFLQYSGLEVEFTSDEFATGILPKGSMYYGEYAKLGFPNVVASTPCVHTDKTRLEVSLDPGPSYKNLQCSWQGTGMVNVSQTEPLSAVLTGNFTRGNVEQVRYHLEHPEYLFGEKDYYQTAKYCPDTQSDEDENGGSLRMHDELLHPFDEGISVIYDDTLTCDEMAEHPPLENVIKLHDPVEPVRLRLEIERNKAMCCSCPEHNSNFVEVAQCASPIYLTTEGGAPFSQTTEDCTVLVWGNEPSTYVNDGHLAFNRNGKVYQPMSFTVLGLAIECPSMDPEVENVLGEKVGIPVAISSETEQMLKQWERTTEPDGLKLNLRTRVGLSYGRVELKLTSENAHLQLWRSSVNEQKERTWYLLLDSQQMSSLTLSVSDWRTLLADDSVRLVASSTGSGELSFAYGCLCNGDYVGDKVTQRFTVMSPRLVFDYDRNGAIDAEDVRKAKDGQTVFRMWVNDDSDSSELEEGLVDLPGAGENGKDDWVNGVRDLVDFTPLCVDLSEAYGSEISEGARQCIYWKLRSECVNALPSSLTRGEAGSFQTSETGLQFGHDLGSGIFDAQVENLTEGYRLNSKLVGSETSIGEGVLLMEGRQSGSGLSLEAWLRLPDHDVKLVECRARLEVSSVEKMFRTVSLRSSNDGVNLAAEPSNWPAKELKDSRNFAFVHGFNVNVQEARAWAAEMFKRLWQAGLASDFTAVSWSGDYSQFHSVLKDDNYAPDYYMNVRRAFAAAAQLPAIMQALPGKKVMIGHSLGNMLVSSAATDYGLDYERYYMLNAAVPMEAYDASAYATAMVDSEWQQVPVQYWASNWSGLFPECDFRSTLSWKGRFRQIDNAINCYSETEDVLANPKAGQLTYLGGAWKIQELSKGTTTWYDLNAASLGNLDVVCEGGWGINSLYAVNPVWYVYQYGFTSWAWNNLTPEEAIVNPLFTPFRASASSMHSTETFSLSGSSEAASLRARFLGDAIPATSFAQGANVSQDLGTGSNWSLTDLADNLSSWPRGMSTPCQWRHSDIKNLPYRHVHRLFEAIVKGSEP